MKRIHFSNLAIFFFAIFISIPVILPYFHTGYFPTHDGEWAVVRLGEMFRELRDFQFPPRFSTTLNFGYGYPLFNFAYPLPYYLGILLYLLKFGFVGSIKILFALSVPFSAFFMFLASKQLWKSSWAGFISAVLYVYLPYRMVDLYVRGSIGESLSFALFPLIFFLIAKIINNPSAKLPIVIASFSYAALIMTHNIMAVLFSLLLVFFILLLLFIGEKKAVESLLIFIFFGILLSSFFWLPAIFEKQYILLSKIPIADRNLYFVQLQQLILPSWGYGVPTEKNGFSYNLGVPHLVILFLVILFLVPSLLRKKIATDSSNSQYAFAFTLISLFLIFLLFPIASPFWRLPFFSEINYPWTLLAPIGFLVSLLAGFLLTKGKKILFVSLFLAIFSIVITLFYAKPQNYIDKGDNYYLTNDATTTSSSEYMPLWVKIKPSQKPSKQVEIIKGIGEVKNVIYRSNKISFDVNSLTDSKIKINTIFYPGWKAFVDGKESEIQYNNDQGVMELLIPRGKHYLELKFSESPLRLGANVLTIISFLVLIIFSGLNRYKKFNNS